MNELAKKLAMLDMPSAEAPSHSVTRHCSSMEDKAALEKMFPNDTIEVRCASKIKMKQFQAEHEGVKCDYVGSPDHRSVECDGLYEKFKSGCPPGACLLADLVKLQYPNLSTRGLHDKRTMAANLVTFVTEKKTKTGDVYKYDPQIKDKTTGLPKLNKDGSVKYTKTRVCGMASMEFLDDFTKVQAWIDESANGKATKFAAKRQKAHLAVSLYTTRPIHERDEIMYAAYRHLFYQYKEKELEAAPAGRSKADIANTPTADDLEEVLSSTDGHGRVLIQFAKEFHPRSSNLSNLRVLSRINGVLYHYGNGELGDECLHIESPLKNRLARKVPNEELHADGYLKKDGGNHIVIEEIEGKTSIENVQVNFKTDKQFGRQVGLFSPELIGLTLAWLNSPECKQATTLFQFNGSPVIDTRAVFDMFTSAFSGTDKIVTPRLFRYFLN